jgi:hypothetical protein
MSDRTWHFQRTDRLKEERHMAAGLIGMAVSGICFYYGVSALRDRKVFQRRVDV